jgi:GTP-binding protein
LKVNHAVFERAATRPEEEPRRPLPLVVFLGRSNVGKSSLINALLGAKGLARTSSEPGRTQTLNFYKVNDAVYFVDLPGYGFAKAPRHVRDAWGPMIEGFLERRRGDVAIAVALVDARHEPSELDDVLRRWLEDRELLYVVAATKADKLAASRRSAAARSLGEAYPAASAAGAVVLASATRGDGIREIWKHLDAALEARAAGRRGTSWTSAS